MIFMTPVNPISLQKVNRPVTAFGEEVPMQIYPVPVAVTQARIQLLAEQAAKAPPQIINDAVLKVFAAKNQAERQAIVDLKA